MQFNEDELSDIPCPQAKLIEAAKGFAIGPLPDNFENGICFGLVGLWSVKNAQEEKDFFHFMRLMIFHSSIQKELDQTPANTEDERVEKEEYTKLIANEMKAIEADVSKFTHAAIWQQNFKIQSTQNPSLYNLGWDLFSKTVFGNLNSDWMYGRQLENYIQRSLHENNFLRIELWQRPDKGHAVGIKKKQGKYYYYDPNMDSELCCNFASELLILIKQSSQLIFATTEFIEVRAFVHERQANTYLLALIKELQQFRLMPDHQFLVSKIYQELISENIAFVCAYRNIEDIVQRILASKFIRKDKTHLNELNNKVLALLSSYDTLLQTPQPPIDTQMVAAAAATSFTP